MNWEPGSLGMKKANVFSLEQLLHAVNVVPAYPDNSLSVDTVEATRPSAAGASETRSTVRKLNTCWYPMHRQI